jgi:hypothetical protein
MLKNFLSFFNHPVFYNRRFLFILWLAIGIFTGVREAVGGTFNNFRIFITSFPHLLAYKNLYLEYPGEYGDVFLYGPVFGVLIAPFYALPAGVSVVFWNVFNSLLLLYAIFQLPLSEQQRAGISWLALNCSFTSLVNTQFHNICAALIILSYTSLEKPKSGEIRAAFFTILGMLIKFYGIVGLTFFLFTRQKLRYVLACAVWGIVLFLLPMLLVKPIYVWQCYTDWLQALIGENRFNQAPDNIRTDVCVMGMFRKLSGNPSLSNLYFIVPGLLFFASAFIKPARFQDKNFQLQILASVLIFIILASTGSESPTMVIGFTGVAIWYAASKKTMLDTILLVFALILTGFSPTDLFPSYLRIAYVNRYSLAVLPLLLVWLRLHGVLLKENLSPATILQTS